MCLCASTVKNLIRRIDQPGLPIFTVTGCALEWNGCVSSLGLHFHFLDGGEVHVGFSLFPSSSLHFFPSASDPLSG